MYSNVYKNNYMDKLLLLFCFVYTFDESRGAILFMNVFYMYNNKCNFENVQVIYVSERQFDKSREINKYTTTTALGVYERSSRALISSSLRSLLKLYISLFVDDICK